MQILPFAGAREGIGVRQVKPNDSAGVGQDCWPDNWRRILAAYVDNDLRN